MPAEAGLDAITQSHNSASTYATASSRVGALSNGGKSSSYHTTMYVPLAYWMDAIRSSFMYTVPNDEMVTLMIDSVRSVSTPWSGGSSLGACGHS